MSPPDRPAPGEDFSDSDRAWLAALTGDENASMDSPATREGHAMRAALELRRRQHDASPQIASATSDDATRAQLERLRARVRAEGLLERPVGDSTAVSMPEGPPAGEQPQPAKIIGFPWWRRRGALLAVAASLLAAVVVVQLVDRGPDYPPPNELMGADGVQRTQSSDPRRAAEQLAQQLRAVGLRPGLYQRGRTYIVDITLMSAELDTAKTGFTALGLQPVVGFNRVEIDGR
jgi:hypothetical protein